MGVARRGPAAAVSVRSISPPRAVIQSATPAGAPFVVGCSRALRTCVRARARAWRVRARLHAGAAQRAARRKGRRPAEKRVGTLNKKKALRGHFEATPRAVGAAACEVLHRKKALRACCGAERTEGSGSGACGVMRAATSFLHDDPVYQKAVDCGCARERVHRRWLAAMHEDACADADVTADGDADEPPFTWPPQPDRSGRRRRERGNGGDGHAGSCNRREDSAAACASRCRRSDSCWRSRRRRSPAASCYPSSGERRGYCGEAAAVYSSI